MVSLSNHADNAGKSVTLTASFDKLRMLFVISDNVYCSLARACERSERKSSRQMTCPSIEGKGRKLPAPANKFVEAVLAITSARKPPVDGNKRKSSAAQSKFAMGPPNARPKCTRPGTSV